MYNFDGKMNCSKVEIGDGATSRVYLGDIDGKKVAVKQLKYYSASLAPVLVKVYQPLLNLQHENVVKLLGICPQVGQIVLEYCEKRFGDLILHTSGDLLLHLGNDFPQELQLNALADIAEGLCYIHNLSIVHGDIKPQNILVCGEGEYDYTFKLADYSCSNVEHIYSSSRSSSSLRQLMTPGYAAPELLSDVGSRLQPTNKSDIYSFGILAYEVIFQKEAWANVSFQLITSVKTGYRPSIPNNASHFLTLLIKSCWHHDCSLRPSAERIIELLEEAMNNISTNEKLAPTSMVTVDDTSSATSSTILASVDITCDGNRSSDSQSGSTNDAAKFTEKQNGDDQTDAQGSCTNVSCLVENSNSDILSTDYCTSESVTEDCSNVTSLETAISTLKIREFKQFQIDCITAVKQGKDVVVVQPTGSGKSVCFILPALVFPGKVSLVIEPVVAVIINQVDALQKKGIKTLALGRAAGNKKSLNYRTVFHLTHDEPMVVFCTPEYLFGTPSTSGFIGTTGQFSLLLEKKDCISAVTIDEAHKIFDRLPTYRPAFDDLRKLQQLSCPIIAMSATLTGNQVSLLREKYLRSDNTVVLQKGVHRQNLELKVQRYKRCKQVMHGQTEIDDDEENGEDVIYMGTTSSMWQSTVNQIRATLEGQSCVVYLDFNLSKM